MSISLIIKKYSADLTYPMITPIKTSARRLYVCLFILFLINGCAAKRSAITNHTHAFVKGADIGWLPQMEATGYKFYNNKGVEEDCFKILKDHGVNTIRLRAWVNPSDDKISGHCGTEETVAMAVRAKKWGMKVLIDLHYSDSWADPGKQKKPKAWEGHDFPQLLTDVYDYTFGVMTALKAAGVTPEWVQVGNETPGGMIWPEGRTSNWGQLSQLINKGYDAVKAVSPQTKVILHIDQGNNNQRFRTWFDNATVHQTKYDVIGFSYYPYWLKGSPDYTLSIDDLGNNLKDMASRYGKEVMVVEVGNEDKKAQDTYDMLLAVQAKLKEVPNGKGLGVVYWEPEGARSWSHYALSAWGDDGRPTKALDAFIDQ
jgi:arabinogalactan endo-1,4-beta-galactosidase